jgi:hypothetical protein
MVMDKLKEGINLLVPDQDQFTKIIPIGKELPKNNGEIKFKLDSIFCIKMKI